jgi:flavin reductase (DIM6/NTAB) family NADH-FMN oxidoreductase RutF
MSHAHFDFAALSPRERYKLLIGTVIPRPIAFITTVSPVGRHNAAPFSFFNVLTHDPAIVAIGVENHADLSFTDNMVDDALAAAMEICAIKFGPDVDELAEAGLTPIAGTHVASPRILEAPASLECRRFMTLEVGKAREIILGEVLGVHIRADLIDGDKLYVDQMGMDIVGRLGGNSYARTRDQFDVRTLSVDEWEARKSDAMLPETTG